MYKESFYNIELPLEDENGVTIFNSKTGSIIELNKKEYAEFKLGNFSSKEIITILNELKQQGFVIPSKKNEFNEILCKQKIAQFNNSSNKLSLIIAPTLYCNFKCIYCFEENNCSSKEVMSIETMDNIISFTESLISKNTEIRKLSVHWFGGEPLLAFDSVIEPLSSKLKQLCEKHNLSYRSSIVTNGYLLSEKTIEALVEECAVSSFQITMDGLKETYNKFKNPPKDAYEKVKNNLFILSDKLHESPKRFNVSVRINVSKENINEAKLLYNEITLDDRYHGHLRFYLGRIRGNTTSCQTFEIEEFEAFEDEFDSLAGKKQRLYEPKRIWCEQYTMNSFCIGPKGELYKCEHDFGIDEKCIGSITEGIYFSDHFMQYMNQPLPQKCKECKIFPLCLGGCPNARSYSVDNSSCEFTKERVIKRICEHVIRSGDCI